METRTVTKLLLLGVTTTALVTAFAVPGGPGRRTDDGEAAQPERRAHSAEWGPDGRQTSDRRGARSGGAPPFLTRFDVALLVLGSLGVIGACLRLPRLVAAAPFGSRARLGTSIVVPRRSRIRYAPLVVLGIVLMTATTALAQTDPVDSPYVGSPPDVGPAPYVGVDPADAPPAPDAGVYVDGLPYVGTPSARSPGPLAVAGGTLARTPTAGEPAALGAGTEGPTGVAGGMPVSAGDVVGLLVLAGAAALTLVVPRWRGR